MKTLDKNLYGVATSGARLQPRQRLTTLQNTVLNYLRRNSGFWIAPGEIATAKAINVIAIRNTLSELCRMGRVVHNGDDPAFRRYKIYSVNEHNDAVFDPPKFPRRSSASCLDA